MRNTSLRVKLLSSFGVLAALVLGVGIIGWQGIHVSQEQVRGLEQINQAISRMDHVVQSNAATAEESASAAEELSAQAQTMDSLVDDLARVVKGRAERAQTRELVALRR